MRESNIRSVNKYIAWGTAGFPDIPQDFPSLSSSTAKDFYAFFVSHIPRRIQILAETVRDAPEFRNWAPDYSDRSIVELGDWVRGALRLQPVDRDAHESRLKGEYESRTGGKLEFGPRQIYSKGSKEWKEREWHNWEFADGTFAISLCTDIGIYLAECLRARIPDTYWWLTKRGRMYHRNNTPTVRFGRHESSPFATGGHIISIIIGTHEVSNLLTFVNQDTKWARDAFAHLHE